MDFTCDQSGARSSLNLSKLACCRPRRRASEPRSGVARCSGPCAQGSLNSPNSYSSPVRKNKNRNPSSANAYKYSRASRSIAKPGSPKGGFWGPRRLQDAPKRRQDAPRCPQDAPRRPKMPPRRLQEAPRGAQDAPGDRKWSQNGAKLAPKST